MLIPFNHKAIKSGENERKAARLFAEYRSLMIYIANGVLNDYALAEDAVSESFIRIIRNLHKINDECCHKTRGLMVTIIRNVAIDMYNKRKGAGVSCDDDILTDVADPSPSVADEVISMDGYNNIVGIINALPETLRDVADLVFVHNYDYKETAELLGISYDNARQRASRAKKIIIEKLKI